MPQIAVLFFWDSKEMEKKKETAIVPMTGGRCVRAKRKIGKLNDQEAND